MLSTILLELFLPFRPFIKTANIGRTTISAQTYSVFNSMYNQPGNKSVFSYTNTKDPTKISSCNM